MSASSKLVVEQADAISAMAMAAMRLARHALATAPTLDENPVTSIALRSDDRSESMVEHKTPGRSAHRDHVILEQRFSQVKPAKGARRQAGNAYRIRQQGVGKGGYDPP